LDWTGLDFWFLAAEKAALHVLFKTNTYTLLRACFWIWLLLFSLGGMNAWNGG
jgi:hypothetical protein